jgi:putative oxidoreductase
MYKHALLLLARMGLSMPFLLFGYRKLTGPDNIYNMIESVGLPGWLVWPAGAFQLVTGILIVLGLFTRWAAVALAVFCVLAPSIFHSNFSDISEVSAFTKDMAAAGGFVILALHGPGRFSLDHKFGAGRTPPLDRVS